MSKWDQTPAETASTLARGLRRSAALVDDMADWTKERGRDDGARGFYLGRATGLRRRAKGIELKFGLESPPEP